MSDYPHSYQQVKAMIKQFTGQANTLIIPRVFIDFTGDHLAAMLLSQILYWSDKTNDIDGWFYKTAEEWSEELGMSTYQVKRASTVLSAFGIETKLRKVKGAPRTHYRIDMQRFTDLFCKFLENQETRKSRNYDIENQETEKTMDFEETNKSYKEQRLPETTSREGTRPAVALYTSLTGLKPPKVSSDMIAGQVTDLAQWEREIRNWLASGHKPINVKGMLDWYHGKGRHQQPVNPDRYLNGSTHVAPMRVIPTGAPRAGQPTNREKLREMREKSTGGK